MARTSVARTILKALSNRPLFIIFLLFILNIVFSYFFFGTFDVKAWIRSAGVSNLFGVVQGYSLISLYYPPLATFILWVIGKIYNIGLYPGWEENYPTTEQMGTSFIPIKLEILFFLYLTAFIVFIYAKLINKFKSREALISTSSVLYNPAYILSGPILGYIDVFFAPFLLLTFCFLEIGFPFLIGIFLALSFSIKLLPLLILPVFVASFFYLNSTMGTLKVEFRKLCYFLTGIIVVIVPLVAIFGYEPIRTIFRVSFEHGANLSNNAANLNYLIRILLVENNITPASWLKLSRFIFYGVSAIFLIKIVISKYSTEMVYKASIGVLFAYFIFVTGAHENHLFPALVIATGLYMAHRSKDSLAVLINISLIFLLNLFVFYWFGYIIADGELSRIMPSGYLKIRNFSAVLVSLYSTIYFTKYFFSFLKKSN